MRIRMQVNLGAAHTIKWAGKRVQRAAHPPACPSRSEDGRGSQQRMRTRSASESEPKRVVVVGGEVPPPERSAAPLWERSVVQTDGAAAPQVAGWRRQLATQPSQRGAALRAGGPEGGEDDRWSRATTKGKQQFAYKAFSLVNQAKSALADRPQGGLMVRIDGRRASGSLTRVVILILISIQIILITDVNLKRNQNNSHSGRSTTARPALPQQDHSLLRP